jgi:hypothetical protein
VYSLFFHAYINEMHCSRSKITSKKSRQAALRGGIYFRRSRVNGKGLNTVSVLVYLKIMYDSDEMGEIRRMQK